MTTSQPDPAQTLVDLVNLHLDEDDALRQFRQRHELDYELSANTFTKEQREKFGNDPDTRTLFFRDLAQRLWTDLGDQSGVELLHGFLIGSGAPVSITLDWRHQRLAYQPKTKLQAGFYELLLRNHLAKRCANPDCRHPYFIGERVDQRYCSDECKEIGRLATKRNWWKDNRTPSRRKK